MTRTRRLRAQRGGRIEVGVLVLVLVLVVEGWEMGIVSHERRRGW